jgi:hypothetical protein
MPKTRDARNEPFLDPEKTNEIARRVLDLAATPWMKKGQVKFGSAGQTLIMFNSGPIISFYAPLRDVEKIVDNCAAQLPAEVWNERHPELMLEAHILATATVATTALLYEIQSQFKGARPRAVECADLFVEQSLRRSDEIRRAVFSGERVPLESPNFDELKKHLLDLSSRARRRDTARLLKFIASVTPKKPGPKLPTDSDIQNALRTAVAADGSLSAATVARFLDRDESAVTRWAKNSKWKTWLTAKKAILAQIKNTPN